MLTTYNSLFNDEAVGTLTSYILNKVGKHLNTVSNLNSTTELLKVGKVGSPLDSKSEV